LKRELPSSRLLTGEELLVEIRKLVGEILSETLLDIFRDWISWCESLISKKGNYFELTIKWWYLFCIIPLSGKDTALGEGHSVTWRCPTSGFSAISRHLWQVVHSVMLVNFPTRSLSF
jgi:hypothetical protein